ncbi:MAG: TauD/TfdA dioxygenase family protein [Acidimicrobiales bacterium]
MTITHSAPAAGYERISVAPLTCAIGAEVEAVQLHELDEEAFAELRRAWLEHKVLFFRDQQMSTAEHVAFGRRFGELEVHPFLPHVAEHPEVIIFESTADKPQAAESWHSDVSFRPTPSMGSILRSRVSPAVGGDTLWANMERAYDDLPDSLKARIEGLSAVHTIRKTFARGLSGEALEKALAEHPDQVHPVVRTHPETGRRCIYVNRNFTSHVVGLEPEESRELLRRLYERASYPQHQCRFRWRADSVALWDNRCTQHYASPDFFPQHRRMERVTMVGDRPA